MDALRMGSDAPSFCFQWKQFGVTPRPVTYDDSILTYIFTYLPSRLIGNSDMGTYEHTFTYYPPRDGGLGVSTLLS